MPSKTPSKTPPSMLCSPRCVKGTPNSSAIGNSSAHRSGTFTCTWLGLGLGLGVGLGLGFALPNPTPNPNPNQVESVTSFEGIEELTEEEELRAAQALP